MLDVDHFKEFNDRYGHQAGDDALAAVGACIQRHVRRPGDYAGRYGGEEFAILLPHTNAAGAATMAETVRAAVQALQIPNAAGANGLLTVSVGVVTDSNSAGSHETFTELRAFLRAGDEALYLAKRSGRNCVATFGTTTTVAMAP